MEGIVEFIFNSAIIESSFPTDTCSRRAPISSRCQPGLAEQSRSSSTPVSSRLLKTKQCYNTLLRASRFDLSLVSWWEKCCSPSVGGIIWKPCEICSARRRPTIFLSATKRKILVRSGARIPTSENPRSLSGRKVKLANSSKAQVSPRDFKLSFFYLRETASILSSAPVNNSQDVFCLLPPPCIVARPWVILNKEHIFRGWNFTSVRCISSGMNIKETKFNTW